MRKFSITVVLCHIFFLATCQINNPDNKRVIIPLDITTQRPILELTIDGKGPYKFIFDTGSSANVIDIKLAEALDLKVVGEDSLRTPGSENHLMSRRVAAPRVGFAGTNISNDAEMNVIALRAMLPVDGILSGIFFADYLVTMDYPGSKLIITSGELNQNDEGVSSFLQKPRVLNLKIDVDGNPIEAHLDTGNPGGFNLPFSMKDKLRFKEEPYEDGEINTPVATYKKWNAELIGKIKVGNVVFENPKVELVENFHFVNLGYNVIKNLRTTIDRKNNLLLFEKSEDGEQIIDANNLGNKNDFTGWYGGKLRRVFVEGGEMYLQRGGGAKLKLEMIKDDIYKMTFNIPVSNELPTVRFERDETGKVIGLTFIFNDGKEDFSKKD